MREMKDSGVEWIGKIPKDWKMAQVRYLFRIGRGRVIAQTELKDDGIYPVYSSQTKNDGCLGYLDTFDFDINQITWTTDGANAGTVFYRQGKHNCTNVCGTLQPLYKFIDLRYQKYALEHIAFYHKRTDTNGFKIMNNEMAAINTIVPPLNTQHRIAEYLDNKCAKIDAIIEREQDVIEKLREYKMSVITEAVTKGLNPDVEMKNSGYEFIGNIPATWKVMQLRYIGKCQNGISKSGEYFGSGSTFVSYSDVYKNFELPKNGSGLVESTESEQENYSVKQGDIFFTRTSETLEEVGLTSVCLSDIEKATFAGFLIRVRPSNDTIEPLFAKYYFRSEHHRCFIVREINLVTRASLGQELLKRLPVLLPPKEEQSLIAEFLERKCIAIDNSIASKQSVINKLAEYKKSLIYEIVTGKKDIVELDLAEDINDNHIMALLICRFIDGFNNELKGRVELQKCLFLFEKMVSLKMNTQYIRQKHGPYDKKIEMYEKIAVDKHWINVEQGKSVRYHHAENFSSYRRDYNVLLGDYDEIATRIINFVKPMKRTSQVEKVATLMAVWNDFIIDGINPTEEQIINEVRTNWTPNKAHSEFSTYKVILDKMKLAEFIPKGNGKSTVKM